MVIKSFVGSSVAEALKMIRSELGPKAVVLKTRALRDRESGSGRRMVEITACLERPTIGVLENSMPDKNTSAQSMERSQRIKRLQDAVAEKQSGMSVEEMEPTVEEEEAKTAANAAIELNDVSPEAYNVLGRALFSLQRQDEAEFAMRRAVELDPTDAAKVFVLGEILRRGGNSSDAINAYERTLELAPAHPLARQRINQIQPNP